MTLEIVARQCAMKSLQEPYKLCRSEPWHNETTSSGWEYKHSSTASTALLQNSIAETERSKRNRTFTLHLPSMFTQCQFHGENLHYCSDWFTYSTNVGSVTNCEKNTSHSHNYVYIGKRTFSSRRRDRIKRSKKHVQRDQDFRQTSCWIMTYSWVNGHSGWNPL